jgi:tetratricopeptide (TPR) repeat protein
MKNKLPVILYFLAFSSVFFCTYGQETTDVKLKRAADSVKAVAFYQNAIKFLAGNKADSSLANISRSLEIASENGFQHVEAADYELLGSFYDRQSDPDESLKNYLRASSAYTNSHDSSDEARILRLIAGKYYKAGVYNKSAAYSEQEFILYGEQETRMLASAAETAGKSYFYMPSDSLSLKWYSASGHYYLKNTDSSGYLRCIEKMGILYTRSGKYN